jgi:type IV pilus assembly protein PilB
MASKPKLGEILLRAGVVEPDQLRIALAEQRSWGRRLGQTLIEIGALSERDLVRALASQLGIPVVHLAGKRIEPEILELIPLELAEKHGCLPLFVKQADGVRSLYLGMEDPSDVEALDDARFSAGMPVVPIMVSPSELEEAIQNSYPGAAPPAALEKDRDPREVVLDQLVAELPGTKMNPSQVRRAASKGEMQAVVEEEIGAVGGAEMLTALTQILIEKGLLDPGEIAQRIRTLRSSKAA